MNLSMFIPLDVIAMRKSIFVQRSSLDLDIAKARSGNIELSEYWCHIGCLSWGVSIRPHPPPPSQLNSYRLHTILIHILLIYICFREKNNLGAWPETGNKLRRRHDIYQTTFHLTRHCLDYRAKDCDCFLCFSHVYRWYTSSFYFVSDICINILEIYVIYLPILCWVASLAVDRQYMICLQLTDNIWKLSIIII